MKYLHTMVRVTDIDASLKLLLRRARTAGTDAQRQSRTAASRWCSWPRPATKSRRSSSPTTGIGRSIRRAQLRPPRLPGGRHLRHLPAPRRPRRHHPRPPRDGHMAFVRSPDNISVELLQKGRVAGAGRAVEVDAQHRQLVEAARGADEVDPQPDHRGGIRLAHLRGVGVPQPPDQGAAVAGAHPGLRVFAVPRQRGPHALRDAHRRGDRCRSQPARGQGQRGAHLQRRQHARRHPGARREARDERRASAPGSMSHRDKNEEQLRTAIDLAASPP